MKSIKHTEAFFVDIEPLKYPGQSPYVNVILARWNQPVNEGSIRKAFTLEVEVPIGYEELPKEAVKEAAP